MNHDRDLQGNLVEANVRIRSLWDSGYSAMDIIGTLFRVCKNHDFEESEKLEFIKVSHCRC